MAVALVEVRGKLALVLAGGISGQLSLYNYYNFQSARYNLDTWLNQHQPPVSSVGQWKYLNVTRDVGHSLHFTACSLECCSWADTFHTLSVVNLK